jgi:hypothetical protein
MSTTLVADKSGLYITQFAAPEQSPTGDRRCYQITTGHGQITLNRAHWEALGEWFARDCSAECEGPHLNFTWDDEP